MSRTSRGFGFGLNASADAYVDGGSRTRVSQNSLLHQVTRAVCKQCNEGWMSRLEQATEPTLAALFDAARTGEPVTLSQHEAAMLARWATKTSWTAELALLGDQNQRRAWMPAQMRQALTESVEPPPTVRVWLASYDGTEVCHQMQAHVLYDRISPPNGEPPRRLLASCLILSGVALLTYSFDTPAPFPPPLKPLRGLLLWPRPTEVEFPPLPVSHEDLFGAVSNYREWLPLHSAPFRHDTNEPPDAVLAGLRDL